MEQYKAFQGLHESWEPGCDKCRVNDTYTTGEYIHTIIPHTRAIVVINVELAQAHPNHVSNENINYVFVKHTFFIQQQAYHSIHAQNYCWI